MMVSPQLVEQFRAVFRAPVHELKDGTKIYPNSWIGNPDEVNQLERAGLIRYIGVYDDLVRAARNCLILTNARLRKLNFMH